MSNDDIPDMNPVDEIPGAAAPAKQPEAQVPAQVPQGAPPAHLTRAGRSTGAETIGSDDLVIPRIKICQGLSKIKKELDYIKDGQLYNTVSRDIYGSAIKFFIVLHWPSKIWFSLDGNIRCHQYKNVNTGKYQAFGPEVQECLTETESDIPRLKPKDSQNYMIVLESALKRCMENKSFALPIITSCMSAAIKYARQLNMKLKNNSQQNIPIWGMLVTMTTNLDNFKGDSAWMPRFSYGRWATPQEDKFLEAMHKKCEDLQGREEAHKEEEAPKKKEPEKPVPQDDPAGNVDQSPEPAAEKVSDSELDQSFTE